MRTVLNFNYKWTFSKEATEIPRAINSKWNFVNLPYCWNAIDGQDGGSDYFRGTAYYAKSFAKMDLPQADRYYLEIQGANSSGEVFLNGKSLAVHHGGYSTWRVDMTDTLQENNLLVITVNNAENDTVYPQMADFTFYGGIYRDVNVICVSESHFDLGYYGAPGIKVTPAMDGDNANVEVEVFVTNGNLGQTIRYLLLDREGDVVASQETCDTKISFLLENAHRWHGRKDPYLYTAKAELLEDGKVLDNVSARFGCRSFIIDPDRGFILNGEEYPLRGVSRHQDRWSKGNALSHEDHIQDMDLICEVGATTIRLAHYQHDQFFYDLCDERGLVIWAEIPYISKHMPTGRENTIQQMKELICQNYNHPSIVVWGLSNEITMQGDADADLLENHHILNDLVHSMDATRLTTIAALSNCPITSPYIQIPDVVSYNHYFGWYGGDTSMNGPWFDNFHKTHPNTPIGCSEYGCEALNWHNSKPTQGDYSEEYQAYYHEELIKQLFPRKFIWATHVWNMFDFGADTRNEGGENGQNHKGLVTFDRSYKKDSFYAYKAWLSDEPFVHICGKRYVERAEDMTKVTVYSNQPCVELFANGVSLGKQETTDHFFYFNVPNIGETQLVALAGDCRDESKILKVSKFNEAYRLREKGAILNWFDITEVEGYLSLNDTFGTIMSTTQGKLMFEAMIPRFMPNTGEQTMGFALSSDMMQMLGGLTITRLLNMAGGMMGLDIKKEDLLNLNAMLNQIKRPEQ